MQAEEYARLREPFLINDIVMQRALLDRREMYKVCIAHKIPVPRFAVISRCAPIGVLHVEHGRSLIRTCGCASPGTSSCSTR